MKKSFTSQEAKEIGDVIGVDFSKVDLEQFRMGLGVELEHGTVDKETNVTNDDINMTGKIAWIHIKEIPDYYTRLKKMEQNRSNENMSLAKEMLNILDEKFKQTHNTLTNKGWYVTYDNPGRTIVDYEHDKFPDQMLRVHRSLEKCSMKKSMGGSNNMTIARKLTESLSTLVENNDRVTHTEYEVHTAPDIHTVVNTIKDPKKDVFELHNGYYHVVPRISMIVMHGKDGGKYIKTDKIKQVHAGHENELMKPEHYGKMLQSIYHGRKYRKPKDK